MKVSCFSKVTNLLKVHLIITLSLSGSKWMLKTGIALIVCVSGLWCVFLFVMEIKYISVAFSTSLHLIAYSYDLDIKLVLTLDTWEYFNRTLQCLCQLKNNKEVELLTFEIESSLEVLFSSTFNSADLINLEI